jgi:membrane protease YdiL (CAAX protease family)
MLPFVPTTLDLQTGWFAAVLLFAVPMAAVRTGRRAAGAPASGAPLRRRLAVGQAALLAITLFVAYTHRLTVWLVPSTSAAGAAALTALALAAVTLVQWLLWVTRDAAARREMWVRRILPARAELPEWIALACVAGVTEELAYRGFLFGIVATAGHSLWLGAVVSAVAFGVAHFPQGTRGMIGIAAIGLVLQGLVWSTGSLIPAMIVHAAANTLAGIRGPRRFDPVASDAAR